MCLLAAEITAVTGKNPQEHYNELAERFGAPSYNRIQLAPRLRKSSSVKTLSGDGQRQHRQVTRSPRV